MWHSRISNVIFVLVLVFLNKLSMTWADNTSIMDQSKNYRLCKSGICNYSARAITWTMENDIDPCDDFYEHTCQNWAKHNQLPVKKQSWSPTHGLVNRVALEIIAMLERNDRAESKTLVKLRDFHKSCMNYADLYDADLIPLASLVSVNGGWPVTFPPDNWDLGQRELTFQKVLENYIKTVGTAGLFDLRVDESTFTPRDYVLTLKAKIVYSWSTDGIHGIIIDMAKRISRLLGFNRSRYNIKMEIAQMITFSNTFKKMVLSLEHDNEIDGSFAERMTIVELQNKWNQVIDGYPEYAINWLEMIRGIFDGSGVTINETEEIYIIPTNFIHKLGDLLKKNSLRTVVNYVHSFPLLKNSGNVLFLPEIGQINYTTDDQYKLRIDYCLNANDMFEGMLYAYTQRYLTTNVSHTIEYMTSKIVDEMERQIKQSTWIDDESKLGVIEKLNNLMKFVGNPSWYNEPRKMDEFYSELKIGSDYFRNVMNINRFKIITNQRILRRSHYEMDMSVYPKNRLPLMHDMLNNAIFLGVTAFQLPFYHPARPSVLNFGAIGTLIGHEVAHIFDYQGIIDDISGNVLWSKSTSAKYTEKLKCFVKQYSNYVVFASDKRAFKIDGEMTLIENIADNAGFTAAMNAYISYKELPDFEDIRIPALNNFTDMQLFFYSFSNIFCGIIPDFEIPMILLEGKHSIDSARVNVFLRNTPKFSEAFNCPIGSNMNPANKCTFWD